MKKEEIISSFIQLLERFKYLNDKNRALDIEVLNVKECAIKKEKELLDALDLYKDFTNSIDIRARGIQTQRIENWIKSKITTIDKLINEFIKI
jgi:flagellar motor switch protein FliG